MLVWQPLAFMRLNALCSMPFVMRVAHFGVILSLGKLRAKKPPDKREDLMEVVKMLRKLQRKHKSFILFGWNFQPFAKSQQVLKKS